MIIPLLFLLLLSHQVLAAEIYQWRDEQGNIHFSDKAAKDTDAKVLQVEVPRITDEREHLEAQRRIRRITETQRKARRRLEHEAAAERKREHRNTSKRQTNCDKARQRLQQELKRWDYRRRKGYKLEEQQKHRQKRLLLEAKVESACRR